MFAQAIKQYSENLSALRDFVELIAPFLTEKTKRDIFENFVFSKWHSVKLKDLKQDMNVFNAFLEFLKTSEVESKKDITSYIQLNLESYSLSRGARKNYANSINDFLRMLDYLPKRESHIETLYRNSLVSLTSYVEWFLYQVLNIHFHNYIESINIKEKTFSVEDLLHFNSIEEMKNRFINDRIENILRGSVSDWLSYFETKLNLKMSYAKQYQPLIVEATQRRNMIIHNNCIVNSTYYTKVPEENRKGLEIGNQIKMEKEYLYNVIDIFERIFVLIVAELWQKISPDDIERANTLNSISYKHLKEERWVIPEGLGHFIMKDKQLPESEQLVGQYNYWQALKWQGRFKEVKKDVEKADFSAKQRKYTLFQLALLDKFQELATSMQKALELHEIESSDITELPIFREFRNDNIFKTEFPNLSNR